MDHHIQRCLPKVLRFPNTWLMYGTYPAWTSSCVALSSLLISNHVIRSMPWAGHRRKSTFRRWPRLGKTRMWGMPMECHQFPVWNCRTFLLAKSFRRWVFESTRNASTANRPRFKLMFIVRNKHRIINLQNNKFTYFNVDGFLISFVLIQLTS